MTYHLSKFCSDHQIVLIALHPNATHIAQPLDVSYFKALKMRWQAKHKEFCERSKCIGIQKYQFAPVLDETPSIVNNEKLLKQGFKKCGLYPFDVEAINYTKVFQRQTSSGAEEPTVESENIENTANPLKVLESLISPDKLHGFRLNEGSAWRGLTRDSSLYEIWFKLANPDHPTNDSENEKVIL